jgi:hypothetical protein
MTKASTTRTQRTAARGPAGTPARYRDRIYDDTRHDPYQASGKYVEPTRCGTCGLVFHRGRWQRGEAPVKSHVTPCPACRRIHDKLPAGVLTLAGDFVAAHRAELVHLVRNEAEREGADHPLHRIMALDEAGAPVVVTTTDIHLPRRIGEALKHAYDGELHIEFGADEYRVRIDWRR